jgi:hypothetical protein
MPSPLLIQVVMSMAIAMFAAGMIMALAGVIVLFSRSTSREVRALAAQTAALTQKGLAEDVAGLIGNASSLLAATGDLVRTASGIGVFLTVAGGLLMLTAIALMMYLLLSA